MLIHPSCCISRTTPPANVLPFSLFACVHQTHVCMLSGRELTVRKGAMRDLNRGVSHSSPGQPRSLPEPRDKRLGSIERRKLSLFAAAKSLLPPPVHWALPWLRTENETAHEAAGTPGHDSDSYEQPGPAGEHRAAQRVPLPRSSSRPLPLSSRPAEAPGFSSSQHTSFRSLPETSISERETSTEGSMKLYASSHSRCHTQTQFKSTHHSWRPG